MTILVLIGILYCASFKAFIPTSNANVSISNKIVPVLTLNTQRLTAPFPLPILTSRGFLLI